MRFMKIESFPIDVGALLGQAELSMEAYSGLQIGDIILLDQSISDPLPILIEGEEALRGSIGLLETHKAILVTKK